MEEIVFFNPGDAIANSHDFGEALRSAEIYKTRNALQSPLVIVKPVNKDDAGFAVYFADEAAQQAKTNKQQAYHIEKRM
ncbi:hypothetical protein FHQ08_05415 [Lactobacillus sp. CC-MHH1034]|uniref:hypothetical protein n=1 Tax=Agrilactobacillus fermenti TaxID=2586909 RepID=UPI001E5C8186|nr:hypothetical protein [Agrilactobacillus fermenti]MCD2256155.1 hypothetical protein [Agrilactobacillus fermenti]